MSQATSRRSMGTIGILQIAIIVLVVITALIHLQRGISMGASGFGGGAPGPHPGFRGHPGGGGMAILQMLPVPLSTLFILNGIGYLVLVMALYLPPLYRLQRIIRWLLIIYTAVTFLLYFLVNGFHLQTISYLDKAAEIALIVLLLIDDRQSARNRRNEVPHSASSQ